MAKWQDRILWLREQAALAYVCDPETGDAQVWRPAGFALPLQGQKLSTIFQGLPQLQKTHPHLFGNLMASSWPLLPPHTSAAWMIS